MTMRFEYIPEQHGVNTIMAIVKASVDGPYRVVHDARLPYVRIAPATETEPITVCRSAQLRFASTTETTRQLRGINDVIDFMYGFSGVLQELADPAGVGKRAVMLDSIDPQHPLSRRPLPGKGVPLRSFTLGTPRAAEVPEGGIPSRPSKSAAVPARQRLVVAPEPAAPVVVDAPVPELIETVRRAEDIHHDLGDYLVIPEHSVPKDEPLPPWVVRNRHVDVMHVHKPRLDKRYALMPIPLDTDS